MPFGSDICVTSALTTARKKSNGVVNWLTKYSTGRGKNSRGMAATRTKLPKKLSSMKSEKDANSILGTYSFKYRPRNHLPSVRKEITIYRLFTLMLTVELFRWAWGGLDACIGFDQVSDILWFVGTWQMDHFRRNVWRWFPHLSRRTTLFSCVAHRSRAQRCEFNENSGQLAGHQRTHEHRCE